MHLGASPKHAATVPLILNLQTGYISGQYHVVFDDDFSTVSTTDEGPAGETVEDEIWDKLFVSDRYQFWFDDEDPIALDDEWLSDQERREKYDKNAERVQRCAKASEGMDENHTSTVDVSPKARDENRASTVNVSPSI